MFDFIEWLSESITQQNKIFTQKLQNLFPGINIQPYLNILTTVEEQLHDEDDKRKSATAHKFLSKYKPNPTDSPAHAIDQFRVAFIDAVTKANAKAKTPEQLATSSMVLLRSKLPDAPPEVIEYLAQKVGLGASVDSVVNSYIASQKTTQEDKIIARSGNLELIEINSFRSKGKERHPKGHIEDCHILFKGTRWCVRFKDWFNNYVSEGPLYLIREGGKPLVLGHKNSKFLDVDDQIPDNKIMEKITPIVVQSGINDIISAVTPWIPFEQLKNMPNNKEYFIKMAHQWCEPQDNSVVFDYFDNYEEVKKYLDNNVKNACMPNLDRIEEELMYNQYDKLSDVIPAKIMTKIEKQMDANHQNDEEWDELDFDEKLEQDDAMKEKVQMAVEAAFIHGTMKRIYEQIHKALENPDDYGFYIRFYPEDAGYQLEMDSTKFMNLAKKNYLNDDTSPLTDNVEVRGDCNLYTDPVLDRGYLEEEFS